MPAFKVSMRNVTVDSSSYVAFGTFVGIDPTFDATKKPTADQIRAIITKSRHKAARRIVDPSTGDAWVWDAALDTHAGGAKRLGIPYDRKPGEGDILTL